MANSSCRNGMAMVSLFLLNIMKTPLLPAAVACSLPVLSHVACAQPDAVNVYVSGVSLSFPDPAGVDDMFNKNKDAAEVMLGFVAPRGCNSSAAAGNHGLALRMPAASGKKLNSTLSLPILRIPEHLPDTLWG